MAHPDLTSRLPMVVFALGALALLGFAAATYRTNLATHRAEALTLLASVGDEQATRIRDWRRRRLESVGRAARNGAIRRDVAALLRDPTLDVARRSLAAALSDQRTGEGPSSLALLARDGAMLFEPPGNAASLASPPPRLSGCLDATAPQLCELARDAAGVVSVDAVAPVLGEDGRPLAQLVERSAATDFLFPLLARWPGKTTTGEAVLVEWDGDEVSYLSPLRFLAGAPLALAVPLTRTERVEVQAALGVLSSAGAVDYRESEVLGDARPIPDSRWILVTKLDLDEVLAPTHRHARVGFIFLLLLLLTGAPMLATVARRRQDTVARHLLRTESDRLAALARYRSTLDSLADGVIATDEHGLVAELNPVAEELTGWRESEARGRPLDEIYRVVDESSGEPQESAIAHVVREGTFERRSGRVMLVARDGTRRPIAESGAPIGATPPALSGVVVVFHDLSEEQATRQALGQSEARFAGAFESLLSGMALHEIIRDPSGRPVDLRFLAVNPAFERQTGLRAADVIGRRALDLMPDTEPAWLEAYGRVALTGTPAEFELPSRVLGRRFHVAAFRPAPHQLACVFEDVTDRTESQRKVAASEAHYRALFEGSRDALMTLSPPSWRFTTANAATAALFGAGDVAEFLAKAPLDVSPPMQADGRPSTEVFEEVIAHALRTGTNTFEWTHRRLSGGEFLAEVLLTKVEVAGEVVVQATVRDVSAARAIEAQVAQSDRLAAMGLLAAGVAHEINNPLTFVLSHLDALTQELTAQAASPSERLPLRAWLERAIEARDGTQRISRITRGLGAFTRVDPAEATSVDLARAMSLAARVAANELRHRAIVVEDYAPSAVVKAPEGRVTQVFVNLLINAAHAIGDGDASRNRVTLRTWVEGGRAFGQVSDTGAGIPADRLARIFEPLYTTKGRGGSGLGLSISRAIVAELGGQIAVESEVGKGTRFTVCLPVVNGPPARPVDPPAAPAPVPRSVRGRILVIDDESGVRRILSSALSRAHEVVAAPSGEEGWRRLASDRAFHVILCDLMMPEMSGMDLHSKVLAVDPALAGRFVFMTGGAFTEHAGDYLAAHENPVVEKPFVLAELLERVSQWVTAAEARAD